MAVRRTNRGRILAMALSAAMAFTAPLSAGAFCPVLVAYAEDAPASETASFQLDWQMFGEDPVLVVSGYSKSAFNGVTLYLEEYKDGSWTEVGKKTFYSWSNGQKLQQGEFSAIRKGVWFRVKIENGKDTDYSNPKMITSGTSGSGSSTGGSGSTSGNSADGSSAGSSGSTAGNSADGSSEGGSSADGSSVAGSSAGGSSTDGSSTGSSSDSSSSRQADEPAVKDLKATFDAYEGDIYFTWTDIEGKKIAFEVSTDKKNWKDIETSNSYKHGIMQEVDTKALKDAGFSPKNGQMFYFRMAFLNDLGEKGPYSNVVSAPYGNLREDRGSKDTYKAGAATELKAGVKAVRENDFGKLVIEIKKVSGNTLTLKNTFTSKMPELFNWTIQTNVGSKTVSESKKKLAAGKKSVSCTYKVTLNKNAGFQEGQIGRIAASAKSDVFGAEFDDTEILVPVANTGKFAKMALKKATKNSVSFAGSDQSGSVVYWRKKGASKWNKKDMGKGGYTIKGLSPSTAYQFKYEEYETQTDRDTGKKFRIPSKMSSVFECATADTKAPEIASISIQGATNHSFGYHDILGRYHETGVAAIGTIVVRFKSKPKAKYAVCWGKVVKINGNTVTLKNCQFAKGSKVGGTAQVQVFTASAVDQYGLHTGDSPKTKKYTVRIGK